MAELTDLELQSLKRRGFTQDDISRAARFGYAHMALSEYVDKPGGVEYQRGNGTLIQAFSTHCLILPTRGKATGSYKGGKPYVPMVSVDPGEVRPSGRKR